MSRRWEYKIVEGSGSGWKGETLRKNSEDVLNRLGLDGWECYHIAGESHPSLFYLKRER